MNNLNLDVAQSTSIIVTAKLQKALKLLQSSNIELTGYLREQVLENPFLELEDSTKEEIVTTNPKKNNVLDGTFNEDNLPYTSASEEPRYTPLYEKYDQENNFSMIDIASNEESLNQHIHKQISWSFSNPQDRILASLIANEIDDCGWLTLSDIDLSRIYKAPIPQIKKILKILKTFSPTGIFAGSLQECIELQLDEKGLLTPSMKKLINHLPLLAVKNQLKLCKICNVDKKELLKMIAQIKSTNPKPAVNFETQTSPNLTPDILVRKINHQWDVVLNANALPRILINDRYSQYHYYTKHEKKYVKHKLSEANWLLKNLQQRANTILKVSKEIFKEQYSFLEFGITRLKPLILKNIATKIGIHESTVSRVCSDKYVETPHGIFELRFFFNAGLNSYISTQNYATKSIKYRIKKLIEHESSSNILSDKKLQSILEKEGVVIARRTIAKYRENLHILPSNERKKIKQNF